MKELLTTNVIVVSLLAILALVVLDVLSKIAVSIATGRFRASREPEDGCLNLLRSTILKESSRVSAVKHIPA